MTDFFHCDVKHQNKQTFFVSVKDDGIGESEPLLLACVNSNNILRIYNWMKAINLILRAKRSTRPYHFFSKSKKTLECVLRL